METTIYSVKQINQYVKRIFDYDPNLHDIWIKGEISNYTLHRSGHMYFSIKDEGSVLKAVMFARDTRSIRFIPKNGTKVVIRGAVSVYEPSGQYQLIAKEMQEDGLGNLHLAYEELKRKLEEEGLFNSAHKKDIPAFPNTIGIITSPTGAAVHDMVTTLKRRYPIAKVLFLPVLVQGEQAPASIIQAIEKMNQHNQADVLIVGRGGGSIEDLWAFNDEQVARAIFDSRIPIISAVGHETDFTISDFVADMRAPTPTGAAEMAAKTSVGDIKETVDYLKSRLQREWQNSLKSKQEKVNQIKKNLMFRHPSRVLENQMQRSDALYEQLMKTAESNVEKTRQKWLLLTAKLDASSPLKIMSKGYHIAYINEKVVRKTADATIGDKINITLPDGSLGCVVETIKEGK